MKHVLVFAAIVAVMVLAIVLLAGGYAGLALGFGWAMKPMFSLDLFQGTIVGLIVVGTSGIIVLRLVREIFYSMASSSPDAEQVGESEDDEEDDETDMVPDHKTPSAFREVVAIVDATGYGRDRPGASRRNRRKRKH